jgi:hypothetical protein
MVPDYSRRMEEVLSSAAQLGWPDFLDFSASPRKESLAAWLPAPAPAHF